MPNPVQLPPTPKTARREPQAWTDFDRLIQPRRDEPAIIGSAVLLTILLHGALFFWVLPWLGTVMQRSPGSEIVPAEPATPVEYNLTPLTKEDLQAMQYVEPNPNAPIAKPTATNNFSNRDQRVAQPDPNPNANSDKPKLDGKQDDFVKIVQGDFQKPTPPAPPPSPAAPSTTLPAPEATAPPVVISPPAALPDKPLATDGEGVRLEEKPGDSSSDKPAADKLPPTIAQTQRDPALKPGPLTPESVAAAAAAASPESRPSVIAKTAPGPLFKETMGTHDRGVDVAVDTKFTQYGLYLSLMFDAIGSTWHNACEKYSFGPQDWGTVVEVAFVLNAKGEVEDVQVVKSTAPRGATLLCVNAVKQPAPYGKWDQEMVALLGERQTIRVTFYYQ